MNRMWMRSTVAVAAAVGLLLTSACGDDGGDDGGGGDNTGPVEWWHIQTGEPLGPVWTELISDFQTANAGTTINETPIENQAFKSQLTTAMQAGDPPDLFQSWGGGVLRQQVEVGLVRDLTEDLADVIATLSPGALKPYTIDGRVYGVPFDMGMTGIWYNKALFEEAGLDPDSPPATWTEFLEAVQTLKDAGITPVALGEADTWTGHFWFGNLALRIGGAQAFVDASEQRSFDNPAFVQAGQTLADFVAMEPFQEGFLQAVYGEAEGQAALVGSGEAAMELMGQWAPSVQAAASGTEGLGEDLGWFPFPSVEGGAGAPTEVFGGGNGFSVGSNAPDTTIDFLRFLFSPEVYEPRVLEGDPGLVTVRADAPAEEDPNKAQIVERVQTATAFQLYMDQDLPPTVGNQVNDSVSGIFSGALSPEEAMAQISEVFQREPPLGE
jgi:raffinose/stachyose/melibiose transport system substrate-binding protein